LSDKNTNNNEHKDQVKEYLVGKLKDYFFDELSNDYLRKAEIADFMRGVPIPLNKEDIAKMKEFSTVRIADAMAFVIGCDPDFKYRDAYVKYINKFFPDQFPKLLVQQGADKAKEEDYETACVYFRAALILDPEFKDAQYCYARALHDAYEKGTGDEYVGTFKAASLHEFETLVQKWPDFDEGYYYLGYAYLNLGLYQKAALTFQRFLSLTKNEEAGKEVQGLSEKLVEPCKIEEGCNAIISGRLESGIEILSGYKEDPRYNQWWPLWYYLGAAYRALGLTPDALDAFQKVLKLSPSNIETMEQLVELYEADGFDDKAEKYRKKIEIVKQNRELDREQKRQNEGMKVN
jgi:tetratricopeptide (TPR) repeat protein